MTTSIRGVIFDIDGVLEYRGKVIPGAIDAIERLRRASYDIRFLTNSTLKSRRSCAENLRAGGFQVFVEEVITASYATARVLSCLKPRSCWVMLDGHGKEEFQGFRLDMENPEYIVVGDYRNQFNFENLNKAFRLLRNGAKLIAMQGELVDLSAGKPELNVGSWAGMLKRASGVPATYIGKPSRIAFDLVMDTMSLDRDELLMVGDQIEVDIKGAKEYGMRAALIAAGKTIDGDIRPDYIFESVKEVADFLLGGGG